MTADQNQDDVERAAKASAEEAHKDFDSSLVVRWEFIECYKQGFKAGHAYATKHGGKVADNLGAQTEIISAEFDAIAFIDWKATYVKERDCEPQQLEIAQWSWDTCYSKCAAVIAGLKSRIKDFEACEFEWEQARRREISKDKEIAALKEEAEVHKKNAFYEMSKLAPLREEIERLKAEVDEMRKTGVREVNRVRHELEESNKTWSESLQAKSDECARLREENDELKAEIERRDIDEVCG